MRNQAGIQWARLFELSHDPALPLQTRLRLAMVQTIMNGQLAPGAPMPSSRELARLLGMSRNTVTAAYDQLTEQGFLASRPRSGFVVAARPGTGLAPQQLAEPAARRRGQAVQALNWEQRVKRSLRGEPTLAKPEQWRDYPYPFVYGTYDPELFPVEDFRECCVRSLARAQLPQWTPDFETDDVPELIEQIRLRLLPKRGVFALKEEILVTVGTHQAFYLLGDALMDETTRLGFEEPGHPHARNAFGLRRPCWHALPVDDEGMLVDVLPMLDYVYVTPSHQAPTTATMGLERRQQLLACAERDNFVIIEDDYEAENLYQGEPMPALKSLDKSGRVIYIGSVSKSLSPAIRLGYIVAPRALVAELRLLRHSMVRHPSTFLQSAYAMFLSLGHQDAHARRVNQVLQERLALVAQGLRRHLPEFEFSLPQGGASVWVRAPAWVDASELALMARRHGVLIEPGDVFFAQPPYPCPFFRMRVSSLSSARIEKGIAALAAAVAELAAARGAQPRASSARNEPASTRTPGSMRSAAIDE